MNIRTLLCLSLSGLAVACASTSGELHEESPGLLSQARVQPDSAMNVALGWLPGGTIEKSEILESDGSVFYQFTVDAQDEDVDLRVDANSGWLYTPATYVEDAEYLNQVSVGDDKARKVALAHVGAGRIIKGKLEKDSGMMMYTYDILTGNGLTVVNVDASTGIVYSADTKGAQDER